MRNGRIDVDFVVNGTSEKDINLFLGPIDEDQDTEFFDNDEKLVLAHFMAKAEIFPSVSQARKNGWDKKVPRGFSQFIVGKKKSMITILNPK